MRELLTVLLHHQTPPDLSPPVASHLDWLLENPLDPQGPLLCWRVVIPCDQWAARGQVELIRISDHRRSYLQFEGELTGGRGSVKRVDQGIAKVLDWTETGGTLELTLSQFTGRVALRATAGDRWLLRIGGVELEK